MSPSLPLAHKLNITHQLISVAYMDLKGSCHFNNPTNMFCLLRDPYLILSRLIHFFLQILILALKSCTVDWLKIRLLSVAACLPLHSAPSDHAHFWHCGHKNVVVAAFVLRNGYNILNVPNKTPPSPFFRQYNRQYWANTFVHFSQVGLFIQLRDRAYNIQ